MDEYKIRVKRDGVWRDLLLKSGEKVKYNVIVNKIGDPSKRQINHSNTYSLPNVRQNRNALGINIYNSSNLTSALNKKYECEIVIRERVEQEAFLVVNLTKRDEIKVNIIDRALDLLDKWGSINYRQLLNDTTLVSNLPSDYQTAIQEMKDYNIGDGTTILPSLSEVGTRGHSLALFPNTLNAIGEKFNTDTNGDRITIDHFNPYQSRPIWNTKAFLDIACRAYGYTPVYSNAVDINSLEQNYIVEEGGGETVDPDTLLETDVQPPLSSATPFYEEPTPDGYRTEITYQYSSSNTKSLIPNNVSNWVDPVGDIRDFVDYKATRCIFAPDVTNGYQGVVNLKTIFSSDSVAGSWKIRVFGYGAYTNTTPGGDVQFKSLTIDPLNWQNIANDGDWSNSTFLLENPADLEMQISKDQLETPPANGDSLIGVVVFMHMDLDFNPPSSPNPTYSSFEIFETFLPSDIEEIVYNENLEYQLNTTPNLTKEAVESKTVKELLSLQLRQQGLLLNINDKSKEVTFFNYDTVKNRIVTRDAADWSDYLLRWTGLERDTDFGDKYAKINRISLGDRYKSNYYDYIMPNQGEDSKYKDFIESPVEDLKDVSNVQLVNIGGSAQYFEYTNEGLGLVFSNSQITGLTQTRADGTTATGTIDVDHAQNVNYGNIPSGVRSWYDIIDNGLRVSGQFLLPKTIVDSLDVTQPIYVDEARSYLIIEEIKEYVDGQTPVEVTFLLQN